jgi:hypothetical protein
MKMHLKKVPGKTKTKNRTLEKSVSSTPFPKVRTLVGTLFTTLKVSIILPGWNYMYVQNDHLIISGSLAVVSQ